MIQTIFDTNSITLPQPSSPLTSFPEIISRPEYQVARHTLTHLPTRLPLHPSTFLLKANHPIVFNASWEKPTFEFDIPHPAIYTACSKHTRTLIRTTQNRCIQNTLQIWKSLHRRTRRDMDTRLKKKAQLQTQRMGKVGHRQACTTTRASHYVGRHSTYHPINNWNTRRVRETIEINRHDTVPQDPKLHINSIWIPLLQHPRTHHTTSTTFVTDPEEHPHIRVITSASAQ